MFSYSGIEIAVIGMSGRFPGAGDLSSFWDNLKKGAESISLLSDEDILAEGEDKVMLNDPLYVKAAAYINDKEFFDSSFFGYRPGEARLMDPALRIFHEQCWLALDDAGYNVRKKEEKIGLFAGSNSNINWEAYAMMANRDKLVDDYTASQLRDITYLCSRISYLLDLRGPSLFINTACSTSLVAIQRAAMSLLLRECTMAIAGGINICNFSKKGYLYQEGMILSKDGHCRAFDESSSGTVGSEGVGVVVLKRLEDALRDRDHIYAVIRGSAVNNDGHDKMSFTAPGVEGQCNAILKAISMAKIEPGSISYVEAHGTGTRLGDPVEIEALNRAFGKSKEKYCAIGSVKTNIGHLGAAAGIAGFIKTVLALKNRQIPASLHFKTPNARINFVDSPFYVNRELKEWIHVQYPLRAGVSSFGIGGTNAHVILEEAPEPDLVSPGHGYQLVVFTAKTTTSLINTIRNFEVAARNGYVAGLPDIAYTLQLFRNHFTCRKFFVCNSMEDLLDQIAGSQSLQLPAPVPEKVRPAIVFMFPGQGSQYINMCYGLYQKNATFKKELDTCFSIVRKISGKDLASVMFSEQGAADADAINNTEFTQPLLFSIEYALARLLMQWGILPDCMIGHSIGEYVAACISGVFSLEDALALVVKRGELMQQAERGAMLSVSVPEEELRQLLSRYADVSLAAVNSPALSVVSGTTMVIEGFKSVIEQMGYTGKTIRTSHAFHSYMMNGILQEFHQELCKIKFSRPSIPFISNLSGNLAMETDIVKPEYWVDHLRYTVLFSKGIENLLKKDHVVFIEAGPGNALGTFVRSNPLRREQHTVVSVTKRAHESGEDVERLFKAIGELWVKGVAPDWEAFHAGERRRKVSLPAYGFDKTKYPAHVDAFKMISGMLPQHSMIKEADLWKWFYAPVWKQSPSVQGAFPAKPTGRRILLFADECGIGEALQEKYREAGSEIILVRAGKQYRESSPFEYTIDPGNTEDYKKLFAVLTSRKWIPEQFIHGWGISRQHALDYCDSHCNLYFYSLVELLQSGLLHKGRSGQQMVLLTSDLHPVTVNGTVAAMKSLPSGLLKILSQEFPFVYTSHIDISLLEEMTAQQLNDLYCEIQRKETGQVIAFRSGQKWKRIYEPVEVNSAEGVPVFRQGGVYFITGGLGQLGVTIAGHLLKKWNARVILAGRTQLPAPEHWAEYLSKQDGSDEVKDKIKRLQALSHTGGEVIYLSCDTASRKEMEEAMDQAEMKWGAINGIIHAAGIVGSRSKQAVTALTRNAFNEQFNPKIRGLIVLKEVAGNRNLDFCLLTSSISVVLGGWGFGAYTPANTYMDYFVQYYRGLGQLANWISVDLDALDFSGQATATINSSELFEVIDRALYMRSLPNIAVSATDLRKRLDKWIYRDLQTEAAATGEEEVPETGSSPDVAMPGDLPENSTASVLLKLWRSFFGNPAITVDDDFFEIGGDSLKALTLIGRIHKVLNIEISVKDFFSSPTIRSLTGLISTGITITSKENNNGFSTIVKAPEKEYYKLSSAQKRLYFFYALNKTMLAYNMPQAVRIQGSLDADSLCLAFRKLIARHEILRTSFGMKDGEPVQKIWHQVNFDIIRFEAGEEEIATVAERFVKPFDLAEPPLLRAGLIKLAPQEHILMIDMPHIVSDGVSGAILVKDFTALYREEALPELKWHYKDFAEWQQSSGQQENMARHKQFWLNDFSEEPPALDLPADFARPLQKQYEGGCLDTYISPDETARLKKLAEDSGCTLFISLLSVYMILLNKLSGQEDLVIGINTTGRIHTDLESVIGLFVNTLPVRTRIKGNESYAEFLAAVKAKVFTCFDHQSYQYEQLLNELNIDRDPGRNPLFDVMFIYQNFQNERLAIPGLTCSPFELENSAVKFDLTLTVVEEDSRLHVFFEYATALFKEDTINGFMTYFKRILSSVITDARQKIDNISL